MTDFGSFAPGEPVPPVSADDLKRVWYAIRNILEACQSTEGHGQPGAMGFDIRLLEPHCEPGADVTAVSIRAGLLRTFLQAGLLDNWREGNEPADPDFQIVATFPMEQGIQGFDAEAFIARLRHPEL